MAGRDTKDKKGKVIAAILPNWPEPTIRIPIPIDQEGIYGPDELPTNQSWESEVPVKGEWS